MQHGACYMICNVDASHAPDATCSVAPLPRQVGNLVTFPPARVKPSARARSVERGNAVAAQWPDQCGGKCAGKITPDIIRKQYNITPPPKVEVAIAVSGYITATAWRLLYTGYMAAI
jgi:hypothetical protein